jgi:hypothetical protein
MRPSTVFTPLAVAFALTMAPLAPAAQGGLTADELRWIAGVRPVFEHATAAGLPVDVVVQPQPTPGLAPLALAFVDGRCKLVFSMRDNPMVRAQEQRIDRHFGSGPAALAAALEVMAAHELFGHCARHAAGLWHAVPEGYAEVVPAGLDQALQAEFSAMRASRREEGYADLAAMAWARTHRPALHARLHAWLSAERSHDLIAGSHHDTLAWLRHARAGQAAVAEIWREVLFDEAGAAAAGVRTADTRTR